eukprot:2346082-Pyramimonas_sp.AAC.1
MAQPAAPLIHPPFPHRHSLPQSRWNVIVAPSAAGDRGRWVVPPSISTRGVEMRCSQPRCIA